MQNDEGYRKKNVQRLLCDYFTVSWGISSQVLREIQRILSEILLVNFQLKLSGISSDLAQVNRWALQCSTIFSNLHRYYSKTVLRYYHYPRIFSIYVSTDSSIAFFSYYSRECSKDSSMRSLKKINVCLFHSSENYLRIFQETL